MMPNTRLCDAGRSRTFRKKSVERFWKRVEKSPDCWLWLGTLLKTGYGSHWHGNKEIQAHRFSWMQCRGEIPTGLCVLHKCDNRGCVNPLHLFLGTRADNNTDRKNKGRNDPRQGEKNPSAKLTEQAVLDIRRRAKEGIALSKLAKEFDIHVESVRDITKRLTWSHIPE